MHGEAGGAPLSLKLCQHTGRPDSAPHVGGYGGGNFHHGGSGGDGLHRGRFGPNVGGSTDDRLHHGVSDTTRMDLALARAVPTAMDLASTWVDPLVTASRRRATKIQAHVRFRLQEFSFFFLILFWRRTKQLPPLI